MLEGVYVANVTPFREDRSFTLDVEAYLAHIDWLAESGIQGVVPFGTNGEGPSVSLREKLQVLEALFDRGVSIQIVPTITQGNLPETLEFLEALEEFPVEAVLVLPPYYYKPASAEGLARFYEAVLAGTGHRVILYHVPKYAVPLPEEVITALPVWGVKDSGGESGFAEAVMSGGKGVLVGTEDDLWERLSLGASGMISALANFVPERIVEMHRLAQEGRDEEGKALSERLQKVRAMTKQGYASPAVLKELAGARHGVSLGTVRPPLTPASSDYDPKAILRAAQVA